MPDDHSELVPLLPIPNRTVKRLSADDSAGSRVKVGHRQALTALKSPSRSAGAFVFGRSIIRWRSKSAVADQFAIAPRGAGANELGNKGFEPTSER